MFWIIAGLLVLGYVVIVFFVKTVDKDSIEYVKDSLDEYLNEVNHAELSLPELKARSLRLEKKIGFYDKVLFLRLLCEDSFSSIVRTSGLGLDPGRWGNKNTSIFDKWFYDKEDKTLRIYSKEDDELIGRHPRIIISFLTGLIVIVRSVKHDNSEDMELEPLAGFSMKDESYNVLQFSPGEWTLELFKMIHFLKQQYDSSVQGMQKGLKALKEVADEKEKSSWLPSDDK